MTVSFALRRRTLRRTGTAVSGALLLGLLLATPAAAAGARPDSPQGATIALSQTTIAPGGSLSFTGTGWSTEVASANGAVVGGVKLDDTDQLNTTAFTAKKDGSISGTVTLPSTVSPGEHWLRFLSGSDQPGDPTRSLHATFTVAALTSAPAAAGTTTAAGAASSTSTGTGTGTGTTSVDISAATPLAGGTAASSTGSSTLPKTGMNLTQGAWASAALLVVALGLGGYDHKRRVRRRS